MNSIKWVLSYLKKYRVMFIAGLFAVLVVSVMNMVNPEIAGAIVDRVILGGETDLLPALIAVMIVVTLVKCVIRYIYLIGFETCSQRSVADIRQKLYNHVHGMDFKFFDSNRTGDIMARLTGDLESVRHFLAYCIFSLFESTTLFLFAMIMLMRINPLLAVALIAVAPILTVCGVRFIKEGKPYFKAVREQYSKLNTAVQENISGNRVVKAFAKEGYEKEKFDRENEAYRSKNIQVSQIWRKYLPLMDSVAGVQTVILIIVGGIMVVYEYNGFTLGNLVTFTFFLWAINNPLRMAGWLISDVQWFIASSEKIMNMLKTTADVKTEPNAITKQSYSGSVKFDNVSFSFGSTKVLSNISFTAEPGEKIAFVGPTGSGKTSIINLLARFYDCNSGSISIDGENIKKYDLVNMRSAISIAMQDVFLFSDTIDGNIAYAVPDAPIEDVHKVSEASCAREFIEGMPEKFDTIVGERGVGLSGGQKQRVALARALMKDAPILVLDDITSAVDMETEYEIQKALDAGYFNRTTFIVAHRISSVKNCDKIFVLENGCITEQGTHKQLLERRGYYYSVFLNQTGDFDENVLDGGDLDGEK